MAHTSYTLRDGDIIPTKLAVQDLNIRCLKEYETGDYLEVYLDCSTGEGMSKVIRRIAVCNMFRNNKTGAISVKYAIDEDFNWSEFYDYYVKKGRVIERSPYPVPFAKKI